MQTLELREQPNSPAADATVLGAILMYKTRDAVDMASALPPEAFYNPAHRQIFKAIMALYKADSPIELPSLSS
ncbi:DnaB-like helicase N-terminal domain-containing protein [Paenibacillus taichungensis]|uniref:DnaB-like helicase N-terminal domain-containing protein n=1 Tax=Paenibacillus taichungensis TaxID=484184 RepID=UPI003D9A8113